MTGESAASTAENLAEARLKLVSLVAAGEGAGWVAPSETVETDMPVDELEEGEEEVTEIPVHGVATLEGKATGDGRGFRPGALSFGRLPAPLGYEFEHGHGSDNSRVAVVGRIDEFWTVPAAEEDEGVFEVRWKGVIITTKEYAARAVESIVDGSYDGLSVIIDAVEVDVAEEREAMKQRILADQRGEGDEMAEGEVEKPRPAMSEEDVEALVDAFIGDGTLETTWFSKARIRRFDMVPTGAFQEGYVRLGHEFADEMTEEQLVASAAALEDCGCGQVVRASAGGNQIVDLTELSEEELAEYEAMTPEEQDAFIIERDLVIGSAFAPGTKDGPGWITHPVATSRIRRYWVEGEGAAKIAWGTPGDFNRCRSQLAKYVANPDWLAGLCANMHKEATGTWPGIQRGDKGLTASASAPPAPLLVMASADPERTIYPAAAFQRPREGRAFAMRIDREARTIQGYAAQWGVCHIGVAGMCQEPPKSHTDYSFFRKGVVDTDEGEQRVALITMGIGHASEYASAAAATAHYDQTDAVRAYINVGEDEVGIWYSGVLTPETTDAQIDAMRAIGRVSGDWRSWSGIRGDLEMVGLVVVNTEGFQLAASGGVQTAAIGVWDLPKDEPEQLVASAATFEPGAITVNSALDADTIAGIAMAAAEQVLHTQKREALAAQAAPARELIAAQALASARSTITSLASKE